MQDCTVNGEVSVNTRKGKTILFYELDVTLKWEGEWKDTVSDRKGTIQMPYISEENDDDDFEVCCRGHTYAHLPCTCFTTHVHAQHCFTKTRSHYQKLLLEL